MFPVMLALGFATVYVSWFAFAGSELHQIAAESAFELGEPDTTVSEVINDATTKVTSRLGQLPISFSDEVVDEKYRVTISVDVKESLGIFSILTPQLSVTEGV